jgi:hypothetical protein
MKMRTAVVLASIGALVLWFAVWWAVWLFALLVPSAQSAKLGQVGDMFGAGSALFSSVAVAAVAVVLVFDVNERRKDLDHRESTVRREQLELRPYVVGHINDRDARIDQSQWVAGQLSVTIVVRISLSNQTQHPALNVTLQLAEHGSSVNSSVITVALPLAQGEHEPTEVAVTFTGSGAQSALNALISDGLTMSLVARYDSLNGTPWLSEVDYLLSASQTKVRDIVPKLHDRESGETITSGDGLAGGNAYPLKATATPGSWSQRPEVQV